jgi:hypothetical protein
MSISAAVRALNEEIAELDKKRIRLVSLRDALIVEGENTESGAAGRRTAIEGKGGNKPGPTKKSVAVKKQTTKNKTEFPKKRTLSPEARKRIADGQKARWAKARSDAKKAA